MSSFLTRTAALAIGFAVLASVAPARADMGAVFVVPSRPGVPVVINGRDASWSVVEGDWGLARPGHMTPTIIGGGRPVPRQSAYLRNPYHPSYGTAPRRGRHEIEPPANREMPEPAERFFRSWSSTSESQSSERNIERIAPANLEPPPQSQFYKPMPAPMDDVQQYAPPIVVVPHRERRRP